MAANCQVAKRFAGAGAGDAADAGGFLYVDQVPEHLPVPVARVHGGEVHDYTHAEGKVAGADGAEGQRVLRDICKWHVEEFAYLVAKLKSIPEGDATVFDRTALIYVHEHAEANPHKNSGLAMLVAGGVGKIAKGRHTRVQGTVGDVYLTVADEIVGAGIGKFPTASRKIGDLVA